MDPGYFVEAVLLMIDGSFMAKFREEAIEGGVFAGNPNKTTGFFPEFFCAR
jgi:hypothetical protein